LFELADFTYKMIDAIGPFIVAEHYENNTIKLYETSVDVSSPIKTELVISSAFRPREINTSSIEQMSLLLYNQYG
jgi:hypothetical protein